MKCPKCGYISFDYNLTCPKCDRDISAEQEKLNLPSFRPDTPALLGALTGEHDESRGERAPGSSEIDMAGNAEITFDEESSHFDSGEVSLPEAGDFELGSEEISFDDASGLDLDSGRRTEGDLLGFGLDTEEAIADLDLGEPGSEESGLDTGELDSDISGSTGTLDEEPSLDLGETLKLDKETSRQSGEILKGKPQFNGGSTVELDDLLDLDEIHLEEVPLEKKSQADRKAGGKKASPPQDSELSLDLGDLDLELDLEDSKPQG
jgi:hypothetical protein